MNCNANTLIPELLSKSEIYMKGIQKRIKIHNIFTEFDHKANGQMRNFIDESNHRYKGLKSGNRLDTMIRNSSEKYQEYAEKVLTDNFYMKLNLDEEKEILKRKTDKKVVKEVADLMKKVKMYTNTLPDRNINIKTPMKKRILQFTTPERTNVNQSLKEKQFKIQDEIEKDQLQFNSDIRDYNEYLSKIREDIDNKDNIPKPYHVFHMQERLKLLTYKKPPAVKRIVKKEEKTEIKKDKLLKFSKLGKNIISLHEHDKEEKISYSPPKDLIHNIKYNDIIELVKNEANNGVFLEEVFDNKKDELDEQLKHFELPDVEEYDEIVHKKLNKEKITNRRRMRRNTINMKDALLEPEDKLRMSIMQRKNKLNFESDLFVTSKHFDDF